MDLNMDLNMDINALFGVLDRRLEVLGRLSLSLDTAATKTPEAAVTRLEQRTGDQRELLADWARVEAELEAWRQPWPDLFCGDSTRRGLPADSEARWLSYREHYLGLLGEVQQKCRLQMAVLRRARRTAAALSSLVSGLPPTYAPPFGSTLAGNILSAGK
jgi:hypothetical protein